jgi:ribonuclease R
MADTADLLATPGIDDPLLEDLRGLPFCTIDDPATRDLDQALHVTASAHGYRLHYALADASWLVPMGSALFEEALTRASSFYLPGLVVPRLPRPLSEGIVSLNPGVDRRALVMVLDIEGGGTISDAPGCGDRCAARPSSPSMRCRACARGRTAGPRPTPRPAREPERISSPG